VADHTCTCSPRKYRTVVDKWMELVLVQDVSGNELGGDAHVLGTLHGSAQVKVLDVGGENEAAKPSRAIGSCRLYQCLDHLHLGGACSHFSRVVDAVTASCTADAIDRAAIRGRFLLELRVVVCRRAARWVVVIVFGWLACLLL
jgi:hypothetical protein